MNFRKTYKHLLAMAVLTAGSGAGAIAHAQESSASDNTEEIEEIITTGSRGRPRTVSDSPVPIDVFSASDLEAVSYTDTNDILQTLVPSYNVSRQPISDGGTFIRPAQLRGMPTDKTLVLVNGKRRHRAALVSIGGSGTQGPDTATIPSAALKSVEVLRDGAAAQYGSDAIAGVINFILKDNNEGGSLTVDSGEFFEGDGKQITVQGNIGLPLGASGFMSISGEYFDTESTVRAEQYCASWFCVDPDLPGYNPTAGYTVFTEDPAFQSGVSLANTLDGDVVQPWGQPVADALRIFINSGYQIDSDTEAYAFGNYSESSSAGGFFYRYPGNGTIENLREIDGSIYTPLEKFPGGFTPKFEGDVSDFSFVGGIRGELQNGLAYDISGRTAESKIEYTLSNTINPSLGAASPTSFRPGDLINQETQFQADFTYEVDASGLSSPVLFAFGASYMDESYEVVEGEVNSYVAGPHSLPDPFGFCSGGTTTAAGAAVIAGGSNLNCANSNDPVFQVVGVGSNGFPGFSPQFSELYERTSNAFYGDVSANLSDQLFLQAAVRYEDYEDFDSEVVYKLAGKFDINDNIGFRASIGTGFRAPTPGQQGTINVSTRLPNGLPVATGLFPAGGPVAQALGAKPLAPETSDNLSFGMTANLGDLDLTVDFYSIDVADRTNAISTRDVSTDPDSGSAYQNFSLLDAAGVAGANSIGGVFYFANAFDTTTQGVDIVASYPLDWGVSGVTTLTASYNYNETEFDSDPSQYLNAENQFDFERNDPLSRAVLTANHRWNDLTLVGRLNWYGSSENSNTGGSPLRYQEFDPITFIDLEAQYQINDTIKVSFGGRNITDEYPERDTIADFCCGRIYSSGTVVGWQGGYYYARLRADF